MRGPLRARSESSRLRARPARGLAFWGLGGLAKRGLAESPASSVTHHEARRTANSRSSPLGSASLRAAKRRLLFVWLAAALFAAASHAQTPPGTVITNTAQGVFTPPAGVPTMVASNADAITVAVQRTASTTQLYHYAPGAGALTANVGPELCSTSGTAAGPFIASPNPTDLSGAPINLASPVDLLAGGAYHQGEALFVRVVDADQNLNALAVESVLVALFSQTTGDAEVVRVAETGANTGEFVGYLMSGAPPPVSGDCRLSVVAGETILASYSDPADGTDSSSNTALVDPPGIVFDSSTGAPVDGAQVTLIDSGTGFQATVLGDDGVSSFPATVTSGGTASDSGGTIYNFPPGRFRFPFVAPGTYRLQVVAPSGTTFPSLIPDAVLQTLPTAPFVLGPGSRGNDFILPLGPVVEVDVPLDSASAGAGLSLAKRASRATAGVGEFVQYALVLTAPVGSAGNPVTLEDRLPHGFRYERGSLRIGGSAAPDPVISSDGRTLAMPLGVLGAGAQLEIRYVTRIGSGARSGRAHNEAIVRAGALASNVARATVQVIADLLNERATLVGRVMEGICDGALTDAHAGVAGVRVFLEDGTHVVTDEQGRFHFPLVHADTHVVQLDTQTVPEGLMPSPCAGNRFAERAYSQFVEPQRGSLWRTDFFLERVPTGRGLHQQLTVTPEGGKQHLELRVSADRATLAGVALTLQLPDGLAPLPDSLSVEGPGAALDPTLPTPTVRAKALAPGDVIALRFDVAGDPGAQVASFVRAKRESGVAVQTPVVKVSLADARSYTQSATWDEDSPAPKKPDEEAPPDAAFGEAWLASAAPANRWLYPEASYVPKIPSIKLGIQHDPALRVRLFRNGKRVEPLNFDGTTRNAEKTVAVSRWRGVDLSEGPNTFLAELLDANGAVALRIQQNIHSSGPPVRAELMPTLSRLVADGREAPVVAVRLFDRWGRPVREGVSGPLHVTPPHRARESVARSREQKLAVPDLGASSFVVAGGGIARVELEPTTTVGRFALELQLAEDRRQKIDGWLSPGRREFTLVALGTGTHGFGSDSGNAAEQRAAGLPEADGRDGRAAFYATGTVRREWQVTAAYDSDAKRTVPGERLQRVLDADEHYTLYGDDTQEGYAAPTSDGIYLKAERDRFYALYGDFETALGESELARYERALTGIKTEYYGDRLRWNGFATDTGQEFARDEIRGNGTSGLYRLMRAPIVINSERVRLEVRDRFRPERVLESQPQVAQIDYDFDPAGGTLYFRKPVPGRDANFDPIYIVVEYEVDGPGDSISGGGRVAGRWLDGALELGASGVHEGRGDLSGDLVGVDATLQLAEDTELHAEWAGSEGEEFGGSRRGLAWLVSAEHRTTKTELLAYAREQESEFGLGQHSGIEQGSRRMGVDGRYRFTEKWSLLGSTFREENLGTSDDRVLAESTLEYETRSRGAHAGARWVHDSAPLAAANTAQLLLGGHYGLFEDRLNLRVGTEIGFGSEGPHGDYDRVGVGADWRAAKWLTLFADHELTFGEVHEGQDTRLGMTVQPWEGGQVSTTLGQSARELGPRTYANLGVAQHWNLAQHWGFDFAVDRSQTLSDSGAPAFDPDVALLSGPEDDDYTAISLGAGYSRKDTAFTSRVETRRGESLDQWNVLIGALREHERTSYAGHVELWMSDRGGVAPVREDLAATRLSLAYRPLDTRWIVLEQVELEHGTTRASGFDTNADRVLNHLKLNYTRDQRTQLSWQYSAKWVGETIDGRDYTSLGHLLGVEARYDLTPRWDVALHARARQVGGRDADDRSYSLGASVGRLLYRNVWVSAGYNFAGFTDSEFSRSEYTAQGPFVRMRVKVDQDSVREWMEWPPRFARRALTPVASALP